MDGRGLIQFGKSLGGMISRNSSTILTGVAVTGLVSTTILGITATPKAMAVIDDYLWKKYEEEDPKGDLTFAEWLGVDEKGYSWKARVGYLTKKETVKLTWKLYLPTLAVGLTTVGCIIGANHISLRRNAALVSLYGLTEAAFKEYRSKVVETIGKSKELKVRDEIAADQVKRNPPGKNEIIFTGKGEVLCLDSLSGRYFKSDIDKIKKAVNTLNYNLRSEMFLSLNEFYDAIGLSGTSLGDQMGWDIDSGEITIDFSAQLTEGNEPCLVLNYAVEPRFRR